MKEPRILCVDVETSPLEAYTWGIRDQHLAVSNIKEDWSILSWAAGWLDKEEVHYKDNRNAKNVRDDKALLIPLIALLEQADIVVTQNGERFDFKKINARAIYNGLPPIRPYRSTDICKESKKVFGFTSHSLEYMANALNKKYKKLKHKKFPGLSLWKEVLLGNVAAWNEMRTYNIVDVKVTKELFKTFEGWIKTHNLAAYTDGGMRCVCGGKDLEARGFFYTDSGKYQRYRCRGCNKWSHSKQNLLSKEFREQQLRGK